MARRGFLVSALFVVLNLFFVSSSSTQGAHTLRTTKGLIEFREDRDRIFMSRLNATGGEGERSWLGTQAQVPIWRITVLDASGERRVETALVGAPVLSRQSEDELEMVWSDIGPGKLDVKVTWRADGSNLLAGLEAEVGEEGYTLWGITFPEIGPVALSEEVYSVEPYGWGVLHHDLMDRPLFEGVYPSSVCAMPFVAVSDGQTGIYVGVEDPAGYALRLFVGRREEQECVSLGLRHDIPGMGEVRSFRIPYGVVLAPFEGDWYQAAQIYRSIGMHTSWGSVPTLAERTDIPTWLRETDLWYLGACHDATTAQQVLDFANFFDVPTSAHIYNWHQIPFDDRYPEYFPAKPGFKEAVESVQSAGVRVMPYINGRLWDPATDSWRVKDASSACALDEEGHRYVEVYGSKVPLSPMCPATELWRETVIDLVDKLVGEIGVAAVYIDQISAAAAKRCFSHDHGHPVGGGNYWIQGYRELLQECRTRLPEGKAITTEENADPWNDRLHAFLMVNTKEKGGEIVPLYPAVYGGRVISFGFQYFTGEDFSERFPLRRKLAQTFVFGSQLGWIGSGILQEDYQDEARFLKRLCHLRNRHRDALQFGTLLPPVAIESDATVSWQTEEGGVKKTVTKPAVLATAWMSPEGVRKIAVANISNEDREIGLTLGPDPVGESEFGKIVLRSKEAAPVALTASNSGSFEGVLSIPALDALVLEIVAE